MKLGAIPGKFLILFLLLFAQIVHSQSSTPFSIDKSPLPKPTSPVMDYAGVMDSATKKRVESKIIEFRDKSNPSVELAVAIVKTTGGRPIFEYSLAVARGWGIGSRDDDNPGALLFIAIEDRKYFTQVSKDLEDELPDGVVGSLQRQYLVPQFKRANYAKGVEDTIDAYIRTIEERKSGATAGTTEPGFRGYDDAGDYAENNCCGLIICGVVILIIIFLIIGAASGKSGPDKKDRDRWGGGGFGGSGGGSGGGSEIAIDILGAILGGLASGASSGGSSSGGWSSGGSSGGSWGGFGGGGDFGGGGAGGGW